MSNYAFLGRTIIDTYLLLGLTSTIPLRSSQLRDLAWLLVRMLLRQLLPLLTQKQEESSLGTLWRIGVFWLALLPLLFAVLVDTWSFGEFLQQHRIDDGVSVSR